ncbi:hypothetical protein MDA_GLEAN10017040 [Myotis davidii]|uniref:Uncharacterized protein n=1 Tax=Myotis davidii TaxID=225400 RepID=L5LF19_MYODS|nr:hypothetical protein MDA_GLEAN10017040 [Myotis davidii]
MVENRPMSQEVTVRFPVRARIADLFPSVGHAGSNRNKRSNVNNPFRMAEQLHLASFVVLIYHKMPSGSLERAPLRRIPNPTSQKLDWPEILLDCM